MFTRIHELIKEKKYQEAKETLEPLSTGENAKDAAYAGYLLGYINTCRDNPHAKEYLARRYLRENIQGDYPHPYAYVVYSRLIDDKNVALNHLNKGLERFPKDVRIIAELLSKTPDKDAVITLIKDREIENPWILGRSISHLISTNQWGKIKYYVSMIRKNQDNQPEDLLHLDLVDAYSLMFGDTPEYEAALKILERIISDDTDNILAYSHYLGAIHAAIEIGDIAKATVLFDRLPVNNSIRDFDDGPQSWDIEIVFENVYKKIFDGISKLFTQDSRRKTKAAALYALYLHYPSDMYGICRYKKSDAAALTRYLKIEFNKDVAEALYDMRCYFGQLKEAYDVLWLFLHEYENPEKNSVFFSSILGNADNEQVNQIVALTIKHLANNEFETSDFVQCIFSELVDHLHDLGWHDKIRMIANHLSNAAIIESDCIFECAYAFGKVEDSRATSLYEELVKREPENSSAINNLGVRYQNQGELYRALSCYEKACALSPKDDLYQNNVQNTKDAIQRQRESEIFEMAESISIDSLEDIGYTTDLCKKIQQISDPEMRGIIQRDLMECAISVVAKQDKLATIMCGSIVEALLMQRIIERGFLKYDISAISGSKKASSYPVSEMGLNELLHVADKEKILNKNSYHLGHYIRDYRNIVHPAKEIRMKETVSHENVTTMWSVLCRLVWDLFP